MKEIWKSIKNLEGMYEVSNNGEVRSKDRIVYNNGGYCLRKGKILKKHKKRHNYLWVCIRGKSYSVHRLVANAFLPNRENKPFINHIDGNQQNNNVNNLEWVTQSENMLHAYKIGLQKKRLGKDNKCSKPINQYDLKNNLIKEWDCINDVERELGIKDISISRCCRRLQKTAGGYIWKYRIGELLKNEMLDKKNK